MQYLIWLVAAATPALAAASPQHPAVTDPATPVPAPQFASALPQYKAAQYKADNGDAASPAANWVNANREMGRLGGHAAHMAADEPNQGASIAPAGPAARQGGDPHRHHRGH